MNKQIKLKIFFLFCFFSNTIFATILEKYDTEKLSNKSDLIVVGLVQSIDYEYDEQDTPEKSQIILL